MFPILRENSKLPVKLVVITGLDDTRSMILL